MPQTVWRLPVKGAPKAYQLDQETIQVAVERYRWGDPEPGSWGFTPVRISDGKPLWTIEDEDFQVWGAIGTDSLVGLAYTSTPGPKAPATIELRDRASGEVRWQQATKWPIFGQVVADTVVLSDTSGIGTRVLSTADGSTLWQQDSGRWQPNHADPASDVLYELDGSELRAVDVHTGDGVASTQTEAGPDGRAIVSFVGGEHPAARVDQPGGRLHGLHPRTLEPLWRTTLPPDTFPSPDSRYLVINSATNDYSGSTLPPAASCGPTVRRTIILNGVSFVSAPGAIYFYGVTTGATVHVEALDAETGDVRWTSVLPSRTVRASWSRTT